jgi:hypothetical protein
MSKEMKLIFENYRAGSLLEDLDLFERHEYIEHALGFKPLLNESGGSYYTPEMKNQIMEEHLLFEGFFDRFNPIEAIKKYGKEVGQLFSTLYSVIKNPKYIPDFVSAAIKKIINIWKRKITSAITFLENKNMPTFAAGLKKVVSGLDAVVAMTVDWKKALFVTGLIIGLSYLFDKMKDYGVDILSGLGNIGQQALNAAQNFLQKEFPKIVTKLYGKAALVASTGFVGWIAGAVAVIKVVNLAKDALVPMFDRYKVLTTRRDDREATSQDGRVRLEDLGSLHETFRKNLGVIK